ncbi:MAG: 7TM diverse intracellular signaling domain-containing protein [Oligoflexus sp.]
MATYQKNCRYFAQNINRWKVFSIHRYLLPIIVFMMSQNICAQVLQDGHLILEEGFQGLSLHGYIEYLEDKDQKLDVHKIRQQEWSTKFSLSDQHNLNWGFTPYPVWLRLKIEDRRQNPGFLVLELDYNQMDDVQFVSCTQSEEEFKDWQCSDEDLSQSIIYGGRQRFDRRLQLAAVSDEFSFPSTSLDQNAQFYTVWIKAQTSGSLQLSAKLRTLDSQNRHNRELSLINGVYFGGLLVLILYNIFVCLSLRSIKYLGYVAYMACWLVFQFFLIGYGFTYFGPYLPDFIGPRILPIGVLLFGLFSLIFAILFLDVKKASIKLRNVTVGFIIFCFLLAMISPFFDYGPFLRFTMIVMTPSWLGLELSIGIVSLKTHRRTAILFLASWSSLLLGSLVVMLRTIGLLPMSFLTIYAQQIGSWTEGLLMSFAMADVINQLRKKTSRQALDLKSVNEELRRHDQLKDEFLANTSHELRTPLHGIIGLAESILEGQREQLSADVIHKLKLVVGSSKRLGSMVNDLLDFSKLQHGELVLKTRGIDLKTNVQMVIDLISSESDKKSVAIRNKIPENFPSVLADENRLQQILFNLIGNAKKFTHQGEICISAIFDEQFVELAVADTGIGIDASQFENIFQSFVQADGTTAREYGGSGLGLTITKKLVELHSGKIWLESELGKGSVFYVRLPRAQELSLHNQQFVEQVSHQLPVKVFLEDKELNDIQVQPDNVALDGKKNGEKKRFRILVADDDMVNLEVIKAHLEGENFDLVMAMDGEEALACVDQKGPFDLVLCDVMMPRKTGYDFCKSLRMKHGVAELPVILLTAKGQISDLVMGFDSGANDYLIKPFAKKELLARMQAHLMVSETNAAMGRFVPRDFLRLLGHEQIVDVRLGDAKSQNITVMFSDIRDFTNIAENLSPEQTFSFVNSCLAKVGPHISRHNGFVDKFIGDAIMALFPQSPMDALHSIIAIQHEVNEMNRLYAAKDGKSLRIGTGLHCGPTMLGTVGEPERFDVTVISDSVNVASRIEGVTKLLGVHALVSSQILESLPTKHGFGFRYIGKFQLAGKRESLQLYEFLDLCAVSEKQKRLDQLENFNEAITLFSNSALAEAASLFEKLLERDPHDQVAAYYLEISRKYQRFGLPDEFDGTLAMHKAA